MRNQATRFAAATSGAVATIMALALPLLVIMVGFGLDLALLIQKRNRLQDTIDAATLAAAKELSLADFSRDNVAALVEASVKTMIRTHYANDDLPTLQSSVSSDPIEVRVTATDAVRPLFGLTANLLPKQLVIEATARIIGHPNICVLALDPSAPGTLSLEKNALVTGNNCAVFSNSQHAIGLKSKSSAKLSASSICTAGGRDGGRGNFSPEPLTDCPQFDDPLSRRPEPMVAPCSSFNTLVVSTSRSLAPGTYCGGIRIEAPARVLFEAGTFVIAGGPLVVTSGAALTGEGVGFYLTGTGAALTFERGSSISLQAGKRSEMAGLLVFEGRSQPTGTVHQILSDDARELLGTLYFPRGRLHIDADSPVADRSAYTAIVARQLTLYGGPHLVLNSRYDLTDVPVPDGIKGYGQPARLVR
jgi:hypothetical protein